jgi:hypothetical protein
MTPHEIAALAVLLLAFVAFFALANRIMTMVGASRYIMGIAASYCRTW